MDGGYRFFRWLFGGLIGLAFSIIQWIAVLNAFSMVILKYALHLKPSNALFIQQVTPGCVILAWWLWRIAAERYQKLQFWYWWARSR
jgi:hypothetical protein